MTVQTFMTARGHRDPLKLSLPESFDFDALKHATRHALVEDVEGWRFFDESTEAELDADTLAVLDRAAVVRLHCHPCRRVEITVNFDCNQITLSLPPVTPLRVVLRRAVTELKLDPAKFDDYLLTLAGSTESLPLHTPIGSLTADCDVELDLVLEPKING
jgi:hypothetical protein